MKRLLLLLTCALIMLVGQGVVAAHGDTEMCGIYLGRLAGTWYDADGRVAVTIGDGVINGCPVLSLGSLVGSSGRGSGVFQIAEGTGMRDLHIGWTRFGDDQYFITVDSSEALLRKPQTYYETVGGVAPGMRMRDAARYFGAGVKLTDAVRHEAGGRIYTYGMYYPEKKVIVYDHAGVVGGIVLLPGCTLHFDRTGLTMNSTCEEFARAYGLTDTPQEETEDSVAPVYIGHGQYLALGKNRRYVSLSLYES